MVVGERLLEQPGAARLRQRVAVPRPSGRVAVQGGDGRERERPDRRPVPEPNREAPDGVEPLRDPEPEDGDEVMPGRLDAPVFDGPSVEVQERGDGEVEVDGPLQLQPQRGQGSDPVEEDGQVVGLAVARHADHLLRVGLGRAEHPPDRDVVGAADQLDSNGLEPCFVEPPGERRGGAVRGGGSGEGAPQREAGLLGVLGPPRVLRPRDQPRPGRGDVGLRPGLAPAPVPGVDVAGPGTRPWPFRTRRRSRRSG